MMFNREFGEAAGIYPAIGPVDLQTGANAGLWINMKNLYKLVAVLYKGAGNAGQDPILTFQQATSNAGAGAKNLSTIRSYYAITGAAFTQTTPQATRVTQSVSNTVAPVSGANPAIIWAEIFASDLDVNNNFNYVQLSVPDTGTQAQLGCAFYIPWGLRYEGALAPSVLNPLT